MIRCVLYLSIITFSMSSIACSIPRTGPEYDALIDVSGPNSKNRYTVIILKSLEGYNFPPLISLQYTKIREDGRRVMESYQSVDTKKIGGLLTGKFRVNEIEGQTAYISVYWRPSIDDLCGLYSSSILLATK